MDSKISEVRRTSGSSKKTLRFGYDAMGNRTAKYVYNDAAMTQLHSSTYYVHDATGNVMAVYEKLEVATNARSTNFALIERHIFGSSRLGMDNSPVEYLSESPAGRAPYSPDDAQIIRILSQKQYELTNHLGNVLATISDRKISSVMFSAEVVTSSDYSPFGAPLQARSFQKENYRYGFNGKEKDTENFVGAYDFGARIMDARIARWLSVDPLTIKYTDQSGYSFVANCPTIMIDPDGKKIRIHYVDEKGRKRSVVIRKSKDLMKTYQSIFVQEVVGCLVKADDFGLEEIRTIINQKNTVNIIYKSGLIGCAEFDTYDPESNLHNVIRFDPARSEVQITKESAGELRDAGIMFELDHPECIPQTNSDEVPIGCKALENEYKDDVLEKAIKNAPSITEPDDLLIHELGHWLDLLDVRSEEYDRKVNTYYPAGDKNELYDNPAEYTVVNGIEKKYSNLKNKPVREHHRAVAGGTIINGELRKKLEEEKNRSKN